MGTFGGVDGAVPVRSGRRQRPRERWCAFRSGPNGWPEVSGASCWTGCSGTERSCCAEAVSLYPTSPVVWLARSNSRRSCRSRCSGQDRLWLCRRQRRWHPTDSGRHRLRRRCSVPRSTLAQWLVAKNSTGRGNFFSDVRTPQQSPQQQQM